jgi:hypothetical protein
MLLMRAAPVVRCVAETGTVFFVVFHIIGVLGGNADFFLGETALNAVVLRLPF